MAKVKEPRRVFDPARCGFGSEAAIQNRERSSVATDDDSGATLRGRRGRQNQLRKSYSGFLLGNATDFESVEYLGRFEIFGSGDSKTVLLST